VYVQECHGVAGPVTYCFTSVDKHSATNTANKRVLILVSDEVVYSYYKQDYVNKLQTGWTIEHRFVTGIGIKYAGTGLFGELYTVSQYKRAKIGKL